MRKRNMLAIAILIGGSVASLYCYARLSQLIPMSVPDAVTHTEARITQVVTPMVKKNETVSEVKSDVRFAFAAQGNTIEGGFNLPDRSAAPKKGDMVPVVYLNLNPHVFLQAHEYADLPRQMKALRAMMFVFALIAMIAPFVVMKHGA